MFYNLKKNASEPYQMLVEAFGQHALVEYSGSVILKVAMFDVLWEMKNMADNRKSYYWVKNMAKSKKC